MAHLALKCEIHSRRVLPQRLVQNLLSPGGQQAESQQEGLFATFMDLLLVALPNSGLEQVAWALSALYGVRCEHLEMDLAAPGSPEAVARWVSELDCPLWMDN